MATVTEIYDYLRVLFARVGKPHCLICKRPILRLSHEEIISLIIESVTKTASNKMKEILGVPYDSRKITISSPVVLGRKGEYYQLLYDLLGKGYSEVIIDGARKKLRERIELQKNKAHSIDVIVDEFFASDFKNKRDTIRERLSEAVERALNESNGLVKILSTGSEGRIYSSKFMCPYDGFSYPEIEPRLFSFNSPYGACEECNGLGTRHFFGDEPCPKCLGARLRKESLNVLLGGKSIVDATALSIAEASDFLAKLKLSAKEKEISKVVVKEIENRLKFMIDVGIDYLTLDRRAHTLSGGEAQRIRLASQLGSGLVGALYVLDEPTIGLHARDNARLLKTLESLRDAGNTIIVVEHDEDTIFTADYLVDLGPGAGTHGGNVVVAGPMEELLTAKRDDSGSLTLKYLRGEESVPLPEKRRDEDNGRLRIRNADIFNLKSHLIEVPLTKLVVITGVSGSGKSTFLYEVLHKNLEARFNRRYRSDKIFNCESITGTEYLGRTILIDQSPIGRTPRSNPATYTGAWTFVRELFASTEEARVRGFGPGRFSFNVTGGRCEACQGNGEIAVEMHFLPTVYVTCDVCQGKRFMKETLDIKYKKKNVHDVLQMTIEDALAFFADIPAVYDRLATLNEVGLGYLTLGQSATTLSGGEAQRVKISSELYRPHIQKTIYLLDEPSIGLHYEDVRKLIEILDKLVDRGNTVVVIEHNMDIIKCADYIIDFGPEGGNGGGKIVARGTPEQVAVGSTHTALFLRKALKRAR